VYFPCIYDSKHKWLHSRNIQFSPFLSLSLALLFYSTFFHLCIYFVDIRVEYFLSDNFRNSRRLLPFKLSFSCFRGKHFPFIRVILHHRSSIFVGPINAGFRLMQVLLYGQVLFNTCSLLQFTCVGHCMLYVVWSTGWLQIMWAITQIYW
jgi:hypothetical protein